VNDIKKLINRLILTDNTCTISDPMIRMHGSYKILYCTTVKSFETADIDALKSSSLIIVNDSINQGAGNEEFCNYADNHNLNVIILVGDVTAHQRRLQIVYFPWFYHISRHKWLTPTLYQSNIQSLEKTYKISCLNANPRSHRIYNYVKLKNKQYFKDLLFSMHLPDENDHDLSLTWNELNDDVLSQWHDAMPTLQTRNHLASNNNIRIENDILHPAYTDSYVNLVAETVMHGLFVTEKTWKPIASGQLFLIVGSKNIIAYLKDFGVDTFDDVIDHKYYDNEPDWQTRIHKIHSVIEDLLSQDLYRINQQTQQRRLSNAEKFFNHNADTLYYPALVKHITSIK